MKKQKTNRKRKKTESLKTAFLVVTLIPIISMAIIIVFYTRYRITKNIESEEKEGMINVAYLLENALDRIYPGDYELMSSDKYVALAKGGVLLDINKDLEKYKEASTYYDAYVNAQGEVDETYRDYAKTRSEELKKYVQQTTAAKK